MSGGTEPTNPWDSAREQRGETTRNRGFTLFSMLSVVTIVAVNIAILRYAYHARLEETIRTAVIGSGVGILVGWHHRRRWVGILLGILLGGIVGAVALSDSLLLTTAPSWGAAAAKWGVAIGLVVLVSVWSAVHRARRAVSDRTSSHEPETLQ